MSPIEDDLVKLVDDLRDNVVDRRAEAEKRAVVSCDSAFDAIIGRAAVEDELGALKLNVPALVLNRGAIAAEDDSRRSAAVGIGNFTDEWALGAASIGCQCFGLISILGVDHDFGTACEATWMSCPRVMRICWMALRMSGFCLSAITASLSVMSGTFGLRCLAMRPASDFSKSAMIIFCCIANFSLSLRVGFPSRSQRFVELARCWQRQIELVRKLPHPEEQA